VVDTTSTISDITLAALQMADHILLICTLDVLSISQTRVALEYLSNLGVRRDVISLVLNQVSRQAEIKSEDIKRLFDCPVIGELLLDPSIQPYINSGTVLAEIPKRLPIVEGIRHIASQLVRMPQRPRKGG
jgi:Flp pilus assembly CpaE family ATPase